MTRHEGYSGTKRQLADALSALRVAREAMSERRGYAAAWEYKYAADWDEEDRCLDCQIDMLQLNFSAPLPKEQQGPQ